MPAPARDPLGLIGPLGHASSLLTECAPEQGARRSIRRRAAKGQAGDGAGQMVLRWVAAGLLEAEQQVRRINGYWDLHILERALQRHEEVVASTRRIA